ncbi:MAG: hypothetical protein HZC28_18450 [Spirochaetes bacterium]|nr:hypothetical protein [Spirochaetota bacterium]
MIRIVLCFIACCLLAYAAEPAGPVFYAPFEKIDPELPADVRAVTNGSCRLVPGLRGQGVAVDAGASLTYPVDYNEAQGTISFWMRPEWRHNDSNSFTFFSIPLPGGYFDCYRAFWNQYRFIQFRLVRDKEKIIDRQFTGELTPNTWHCFTLTWNRDSGMKLYIDGKPAAVVEKTWSTEGRGIKPLTISHRTGVGGVMDDLTMWDRELTVNEIERLSSSLDFASAPAAAASPLPAPLWRIDFNDTLNAAAVGKTITADAGVRITFVDGIDGSAGMIKKWAYDQKASLSYSGVELAPRSTLRFCIKPMWSETAPRYELFNLVRQDAAVECYKDLGSKLVLRMRMGAVSDVLEIDNCLVNQEWNRVLIRWDVDVKRFGLVVNEKPFNAQFRNITSPDVFSGQNFTAWVGSKIKNNFQSESADAAFDLVALFPATLPTGEAAAFFRTSDDTSGLVTVAVPSSSQGAQVPVTGPLNAYGGDVAFFHRAGITGAAPLSADRRGTALVWRMALNFATNESRSLAMRFTTRGLAVSAGYDPATGIADILCEGAGKSFKLKTLYPLSAGDITTLALTWDDTDARLWAGAVPQSRIAHGGLVPGDMETVRYQGGKTRLLEAALVGRLLDHTELIALENAWAERETPASALTRDEATWWSSDGATVRTTASRNSMLLNSIWRWQPASRPLAFPSDGDTRYYGSIPGRWLNVQSSPKFSIRDGSGKVITDIQNRNLKTIRTGWYGRSVTIPDAGRAYIRIPYVGATCARFFVNGILVDTYAMENTYEQGIKSDRYIDVSRFAGRSCRIDVELYFENEKFIGGVSLLEPELMRNTSGVFTAAALARTSVNAGRLDISGTLLNHEGRRGAVSIDAVVRDRATGATVKTLPQVKLELSGGREESWRLTAPWNDAALWSPDRPQLYTFTVRIKDASGALLDEDYARAFGFRDFAFGTNCFLLNGKKTHLFYNSGVGDTFGIRYDGDTSIPGRARTIVAAIKATGYNSLLVENIYNKDLTEWYKGKSPIWQDEILTACDELGMMAIMLVPEYDEFTVDAEYRETSRRILAWLGNHPSLIMYLNDFNKTHYALNQHPSMVNNYSYMPRKEATRRNILKGDAIWNDIDPTRRIFHNAGGNLTSLYTTMHYMSFGLPLQEREDWPSQWLRTNLFMDSETGFPYPGQFLDFDQPNSHQAKFLLSEHAARFMGEQAYTHATEEYGKLSGLFCSMWSTNDDIKADFLTVKATIASNHIRAWRGYDTSGIGIFAENAASFYKTGPRGWFWSNDIRYPNPKAPGIKPDAIYYDARFESVERPSSYQAVLASVLAPVKVWIIHDTNQWNAKDHAYYTGEQIRKQAMVLNDRSVPLAARITVRATGDGAPSFSWQTNVNVPPGGQQRISFMFTAPSTDRKIRFRLDAHIESTEAGSNTDSIMLEVFPREAAPKLDGVGLYDTRGYTSRLLDTAGIPYRRVGTADDAKGLKILIVGRETLGPMADGLLDEIESRGMLEGLTLLIFEQKTCNLGNLLFEEERQRRVFPKQTAHPVLRGLDELDLRDWRGGSDLASINEKADIKRDENSPHYPLYKYTCGSSGIVSSYVVRIPPGGGWMPILSCGFDLVNSPLIERRGRGRVVLCQLDVTRRYGTDPAATRLVNNMFAWLNSTPPAGTSRTAIYDPGRRVQDVIENGQLKRISSLSDISGYDTVFCCQSPAAELEAARSSIAAFVSAGGTFLWQGRTPDGRLDWAPVDVNAETRRVFRGQITDTAAGSLFTGLGNSDFNFRKVTNVSVFHADGARAISDPPLAIELSHGKGRMVFIGISIEDLAVTTVPKGEDYVSFIDRFTALKPLRMVNTVMANCGAPLGQRLFGLKRYLNNRLSALDTELGIDSWRFRIDPEDEGMKAGWHTLNAGDGWAPIETGVSWESQGYTMTNRNLVYTRDKAANNKHHYDGVAWYRAEFFLPESARGFAQFQLLPGIIDDFDETFVNGTAIGSTGKDTPRWWTVERSYAVSKDLLKFGQSNVITIRVYDQYGDGLVKGPVRLAIKAEGGMSMEPSLYPGDYPRYDVNAFHNW